MSNAADRNPAGNVPRRRYRFLWFALGLVAIVAVVVAWVDWAPSERLIREARLALSQRDLQRAEQLGRRLIVRADRRFTGHLIVADALAQQGQFDKALEHLSEIPDGSGPVPLAARLSEGEILANHLFRLTPAVNSFRRALALEPGNAVAHERLSYLLGISGLSSEALPHRMMLLRLGRFSGVHLILLALGNTAEENPDIIRRFHESSPTDPLACCGQARAAIRANRPRDAEALLQQALDLAPEHWEAQAWYGMLLLESGRQKEWEAWARALAPEADSSAEIWFTRGLQAESAGENSAAVRCFGEAVFRDPNHQPASYHLAHGLIALGETQNAEPFIARARWLGDLIVAAKTFQISNGGPAMEQAARLTEQLQLEWEAWGWRRLLAESRGPAASIAIRPPQVSGNVDPEAVNDELLRRLRIPRDFDVRRQLDLPRYPLPKQSSATARDFSIGSSGETAAIRFRDDTTSAGIEFTFVNGSRPETAGEFMYEFSGGGTAIVDFDGDDWPDLYLTQGSDWPPKPEQRRHLDRLFRNEGNGRFVDVTEQARIVEGGFSQGASVGDFDNDGFADLYVGNIGANRLFRNQGDGTFVDVTDKTQTDDPLWTTSSVVADLNGDGLPDILSINYVEGGDLFERPCLLSDGSPRLCTPHEFPAAPDHLYLSLGNGSFREVSAECGLNVPDGKGLGVVAANFDHSGRLSLFVANDAVPNFFFVNEAPAGQMPHFAERAFVSGTAVDGEGLAQACMGVAFGDVNGDGLPDLLVTNFYHESNTLYVQQAELLFADVTRAAGLREPSFDMLGFGTQALDVDLDGWLDLVVTNGHVGNLERHGVPYAMPTQVFHNTGRGRFIEISRERLGSFFEKSHLGRGLARWDWNRDGREDFVVSHLEERAALLTNDTERSGHSLRITLRGVESSRDAIGARVHVTAGGATTVRELAGGDGYQASNERRLVFGLGPNERAERVEIHWPSGRSQSFVDVNADLSLIFIEGRPEPVLLH